MYNFPKRRIFIESPFMLMKTIFQGNSTTICIVLKSLIAVYISAAIIIIKNFPTGSKRFDMKSV